MKRQDALALLALTAAILLIYSKVLFTNLVPGSGDFVFYFAPYWDYVNEALRAGRLPLWNPYLYAGAPLQANPQTMIFYPLRWLFVPFGAEKGILWSAALHAWLTGVFAYFLARRAARVGVLAGLTAALVFSLNGWMTGLLVHPNRWASMPWLPAALLAWELRPANALTPRAWDRRTRRWLALLVLIWTLALLAGHSQTFYNQAVIFACWAAAPALWAGGRAVWARIRRMNSGSEGAKAPDVHLRGRVWRQFWPIILLLVLIFSLTFTFSAVQTLPTLELSGLSYRSGGLAFRDHAALSLPPWRLGFTLLPQYARDLGQALGTDAYGEWIAYTGVIGLLLAALGFARGPKRARFFAAALVAAGIFLALGAYNPVSYVLHRFVPGWDLFRVPARWLQATVLGLSLLAAIGMENFVRSRRFSAVDKALKRLLQASFVLALALGLFSRPNVLTLAGWAGAALAAGLALRGRRRARRWAAGALLVLLLAELYAASFALPIQHPTAPQALRSWRTAPARIAAELGPEPRDGACRTLSLSTTTYDPGDLADLRAIYGPYLDARALADLENATKAKEVLAPNLGLLYRLPSLDGFGGGVLPTQDFVQTMGLFLPPDRLVADGRLREQLREVPDARLLSLFGVCAVITDKTFDAWSDGVYYDLAFGETLSAAQPQLRITDLPAFPATHIGIVSHVVGDSPLVEGEVLAEIDIVFEDGETVTLPLRAGVDTGPPSVEIPGLPAVPWRYEQPGHDFITRLTSPQSGQITALNLSLRRNDIQLFVRGLAVIDEVSGAHAAPPVSRHPWRRIHSGDVKIYRNDGVLPRAFLVPRAELSPDDAATLDRLLDPAFDPAAVVVLAEGEPLNGGRGTVEIVSYAPERIRIRSEAAAPAALVLADAWYPGWRATLDPDGAALDLPVQRADLLLRAVSIPAGRHDLLLEFRPVWLRRGALLSGLTALALLFLALKR